MPCAVAGYGSASPPPEPRGVAAADYQEIVRPVRGFDEDWARFADGKFNGDPDIGRHAAHGRAESVRHVVRGSLLHGFAPLGAAARTGWRKGSHCDERHLLGAGASNGVTQRLVASETGTDANDHMAGITRTHDDLRVRCVLRFA
jgi:hypothetical protein